MRNSDVLLDKIYDVSNSYSEFITVDCYLPSPSERVRLKVQEKEYYRKERREALLRSCIFGESIKRQQVSQEELNQFKVGDKAFENLLIKNLESSSIDIERSTLLKGVFFSPESKNLKVRVVNSLLTSFGDYSFDADNRGYVSLKNCNFTRDIVIFSGNKNVNLNNLKGKKLTIILGHDQSLLKNKISFEGYISFELGIEIVSLNDPNLNGYIEDDFIPEELVGTTCPDGVNLDHLSFKSVYLDSDIEVKGINCKNFTCTNSNFTKSLSIKDCTFTNLCVESSFLSKEHSSLINEVKVKELIKFQHVSFYTTNFTYSDFSTTKKILVENCNLEGVKNINTSWNLEAVEYSQSTSNYLRHLSEEFKNEGNLEQHLKVNLHLLENVRKTSTDSIDRLLLTLSYFSSKHGTCFKTSIYSLLLFNTALCLLSYPVMSLFGYFIEGVTDLSQVPFLSLVDFMKMMNPAHKLSDLNYSGGDIFYVINFLIRIFNGYFIFQIIKSSRKFVV